MAIFNAHIFTKHNLFILLKPTFCMFFLLSISFILEYFGFWFEKPAKLFENCFVFMGLKDRAKTLGEEIRCHKTTLMWVKVSHKSY